jgi:ATP-dependent metalloprotease
MRRLVLHTVAPSNRLGHIYRNARNVHSTVLRLRYRERSSMKPRRPWSKRRGLVSLSSEQEANVRLMSRLEAEANASPADAAAQAEYMRYLANYMPEEAVRRFTSGRFASSEAVVLAYVNAAAKVGRLDASSLRAATSEFGSGRATTTGASAFRPQPQQQFANGAPFAATGGGSGAAAAAAGPIEVSIAPPGFRAQLFSLLGWSLKAIILVSAISVVMDERAGGNGAKKGMMGLLGKNEAKQAEESDTTFDDVMGCEEPKQELLEIVEYLADPERFTRLGGKLPKGVLLMGPPGTGKTLLARAVAGEAGVPFFYASGSEFEEMFVGVGARRVRDLFNAAKENAPCIVFIDEIDAVGGKRSGRDQQAMKMTLNQLLVEMDGFENNEGVIVIGATNLADALDPALMRPGRFDRHVNVPLPDLKGREAILDLYLDRLPTTDDVCSEILARGTPGASGAELFNVVNSAALQAAFDDSDFVSMADLEYAKDKILMGPEKRSAVLRPEVMRCTAFHEGGHALMAILTKGSHPIHKATIMPRGRALGMVHQLPAHDVVSVTKKELEAQLDVLMGGRVAEEIVYGEDHVTTGASNDMMRATSIARDMVTLYGYAKDQTGLMYVTPRDMIEGRLSAETKEVIDTEVRKVIDASYVRAKKLMTINRTKLDRIAEALLKFETITGEEVKMAAAGKAIIRA